MAPLIVMGKKEPAVPLAPYETPLSRLLQKGTLLQVPGKKASVIIDLKPEVAPFGYPRPTIQFHLSW